MENSSSGLKKGPWTPEEDQKLIHYIQIHGRPGNWLAFPKYAGLQRCGKSCRLRWMNYLRPDIKRGSFSSEEDDAIIQLHRSLGNKWSAIASRLPGRTDNEIKNYWNTHIKKRLIGMGLDPITHSPRLDLMDFSSLLGSAQLSLTSWLGLQALINHPELLRIAAATLMSNNNISRNLEVRRLDGHDQNIQLKASNTQVLQMNYEWAQPENIMISDIHDSPSFNAIDDHQAKTEMITTDTYHYVDDGQSWKDIQDNELPLLSGVDQISRSSTSYNPIMANVSHDDNSFFGSLINSCDHQIQDTEDIDHERDNGYFSNMLHFDIQQNQDFDDFM